MCKLGSLMDRCRALWTFVMLMTIGAGGAAQAAESKRPTRSVPDRGTPAGQVQAAPGRSKTGASGSRGTEVKLEDGRKVRAYSFGTLDLEGKLRTPQLLYFLGRVRAELDSTTQLRRSFIPELMKTADEEDL